MVFSSVFDFFRTWSCPGSFCDRRAARVKRSAEVSEPCKLEDQEPRLLVEGPGLTRKAPPSARVWAEPASMSTPSSAPAPRAPAPWRPGLQQADPWHVWPQHCNSEHTLAVAPWISPQAGAGPSWLQRSSSGQALATATCKSSAFHEAWPSVTPPPPPPRERSRSSKLPRQPHFPGPLGSTLDSWSCSPVPWERIRPSNSFKARPERLIDRLLLEFQEVPCPDSMAAESTLFPPSLPCHAFPHPPPPRPPWLCRPAATTWHPSASSTAPPQSRNAQPPPQTHKDERLHQLTSLGVPVPKLVGGLLCQGLPKTVSKASLPKSFGTNSRSMASAINAQTATCDGSQSRLLVSKASLGPHTPTRSLRLPRESAHGNFKTRCKAQTRCKELEIRDEASSGEPAQFARSQKRSRSSSAERCVEQVSSCGFQESDHEWQHSSASSSRQLVSASTDMCLEPTSHDHSTELALPPPKKARPMTSCQHWTRRHVQSIAIACGSTGQGEPPETQRVETLGELARSPALEVSSSSEECDAAFKCDAIRESGLCPPSGPSEHPVSIAHDKFRPRPPRGPPPDRISAEKGVIQHIRPSEIRFGQKDISLRFSDGRTLTETAVQIAESQTWFGFGEGEVPPMYVLWVPNDEHSTNKHSTDGAWYTLDNRRLGVCRLLEMCGHVVEVPCLVKSLRCKETEFNWKHSTRCDGESIMVRYKGGSYWIGSNKDETTFPLEAIMDCKSRSQCGEDNHGRPKRGIREDKIRSWMQAPWLQIHKDDLEETSTASSCEQHSGVLSELRRLLEGCADWPIESVVPVREVFFTTHTIIDGYCPRLSYFADKVKTGNLVPESDVLGRFGTRSLNGFELEGTFYALRKADNCKLYLLKMYQMEHLNSEVTVRVSRAARLTATVDPKLLQRVTECLRNITEKCGGVAGWGGTFRGASGLPRLESVTRSQFGP